jgi:serine/threonine-protein kinase
MLTQRITPLTRTPGQALRVGEILQGTYEVIRLAGSGGMGEVYETRHLRIPGRFAVKVLHREDVPDSRSLARFRREADITSSLRHPNIVQVLDFNELPDGAPYIVMEYLDGMDLAQRLHREGTLPPFEVARYVSQMASALAAAHEHGVVHRDLKPQNVFLVPMAGQTRQFVKILDFGISTVKGTHSPGEKPTSIIGTPQYMSPEQAAGDGREVDSRTDQFALAAIAYEMLTGAPAFPGEELPAVLYQVMHVDPAPLGDALKAMIGERGEAVLRRAMAKRPEDRYPGVLEFAAAFHEAVLWAGATPRPTPVQSPAVTGTTGAHAAAAAPGAAPAGSPLTGVETLRAPLAQPAISQRRHRLSVAALAVVAGAGWITAFASPRVVEEPLGKLAAPLIAEANQLRIATRPSQMVYLSVAQPPPGLRASVDGEPTAIPISLVRGSAAYRIRFEAPGFEAHETWVDAVTDRVLELPMRRRSDPGRQRRP